MLVGARGEGLDRMKVGVMVVTVVVYPLDKRQEGRRGQRGWGVGGVDGLVEEGARVPGSTILSPNPSSPFDN